MGEWAVFELEKSKKDKKSNKNKFKDLMLTYRDDENQYTDQKICKYR